MEYYTGVFEVQHACLPLAQAYIYQYVSQVEAFSSHILLHFCIQEVTLAVNKIFSETGCAVLCLHPVVSYVDICESRHTHDNIVISCKLASFVRLYILVLFAALLSKRPQVSVMSLRRVHPMFTEAAHLGGHVECCTNLVAKLKRKCLIKKSKLF
jgi:hypothetical protein